MIESTGTSATSSANELGGKVAVVTGSSSGIGRAIALELARAGADLVIHARSNRAGAEATARKVESLGQRSCIVMADLQDPSHQDRLVAEAWQWQDGVDIWINNAGVDVLTGTNATLSFEQKLARLWAVDVVATMRLSRGIGEKMCERKGENGESVILNVGWDQAEHGMAGDSGEMFGAIKGAVIAFSKSLAKSLAPYVRVNCVAPGWINTSWGENASEYWQARATGESLLRRWGTPSDIAKTAAFLASDQSSFINGQVVNVNGGFRFMDSDN